MILLEDKPLPADTSESKESGSSPKEEDIKPAFGSHDRLRLEGGGSPTLQLLESTSGDIIPEVTITRATPYSSPVVECFRVPVQTCITLVPQYTGRVRLA